MKKCKNIDKITRRKSEALRMIYGANKKPQGGLHI